MNYFEGLKRLFLIASLLVVAAAALGGWEEARPAKGCEDDAYLARMNEMIADASRSVAAVTGRSASPPIVIRDEPEDSGWRLFDRCLTGSDATIKRASYAAFFGICAAIALLLIWSALRWVILGFSPGTARKP